MRRGVLIAGLCALLVACGGNARVVDPQIDLHLSGNWNDADARDVVAAVTPQCLAGGWLDAFHAREGRAPVVRVGRVRVRTAAIDDEIEPGILTDDLARALISSGRVRVIAARAEAAGAGGARDTRVELAEHAALAPVGGQELAADYLLTGSILTQDDQVLDPGVTGTYRQVKFYQATFELTDLTTNEKAWIGSAERKKLIEQSTTGW